MVPCQKCGTSLPVIARQQETQTLLSTQELLTLRIAWEASAPRLCPKCGELIPEGYLFEKVPIDILITEGARAMSLAKKSRLSSERAQAMAFKSWRNRRARS